MKSYQGLKVAIFRIFVKLWGYKECQSGQFGRIYALYISRY